MFCERESIVAKKETMEVVHVRLPVSQITALDAIVEYNEYNMGSRGQEIRKAVHEYLKHYPKLYPVKDRLKEEGDG